MLHIKIDTNDRKLIVTHHVIEFLCQGYPRSQDYKGPWCPLKAPLDLKNCKCLRILGILYFKINPIDGKTH